MQAVRGVMVEDEGSDVDVVGQVWQALVHHHILLAKAPCAQLRTGEGPHIQVPVLTHPHVDPGSLLLGCARGGSKAHVGVCRGVDAFGVS